MDKGNAIELKDVKKSFKIYYDKGSQLKEKLLFRNRNRYEKREVLKGISFNVKKGEAIGLIGHNGCGKSTTLKLLTKIIYPDEGTIEMAGRVSSLIELGAGFHPDMSGRENIYTNASIFGLSRKEIDNRIQDIIDFSEIEEFIDNPVRTYSSGMYMRLAFSVAINVDADILLIDEILGVGDSGFQTKCFNRLREIKAKGTTIVIVSHSLGQIEQICDRSLWIHEGDIVEEGKPRDVHPKYMEYMAMERKSIADKEYEKNKKKEDKKTEIVSAEDVKAEKNPEDTGSTDKKRWGNGDVTIKSAILYNDMKETDTFVSGELMKLRIKYEVNKGLEDACVGIALVRTDGVVCYGTNTLIDGKEKFSLEEDGEILLEIPNMPLVTGQYVMDIAINGGDGAVTDYWSEAVKFNVFSKIQEVGVMRIEHSWKFE